MLGKIRAQMSDLQSEKKPCTDKPVSDDWCGKLNFVLKQFKETALDLDS
jgi:hypothetical protein